MASQKLFRAEFQDPKLRENFGTIETFMLNDLMSRGRFKFFEINFVEYLVAGVPQPQAYPHRLNFIPKDVIQLSVRDDDGAAVTWHFDDFTSTHIYVTTSRACTVRAFIGRYGENP